MEFSGEFISLSLYIKYMYNLFISMNEDIFFRQESGINCRLLGKTNDVNIYL